MVLFFSGLQVTCGKIWDIMRAFRWPPGQLSCLVGDKASAVDDMGDSGGRDAGKFGDILDG